jgi:type IV pilus assembly protein PilC
VASFAYSAINSQGVELSGEISAADLGAARELLRVKGLLAQSLKEIADVGSGLGQTSIGNKKVKPKSLQIFSRQFATMIEAGLNVVSALVILEEQTDDEALGAVILELRKDVEGGLLLSEAMIRHPKVFSRLYVSMVEAGEAAGILDIVLDRVAFQIEKQEAIRRRVKSAMVYPTMVLIFATLVLVGMLMFLVPIFVKIFASLNGQLPTLTAYVVAVSNLLRSKPYLILLIPLSLWLFFKWKKTENGRKKWDAFKLKLPMRIGDTVLKITMARFSRTLSTLVAAGVDIIKALEITGQTSGNWVIEEALAGVRAKVHEGVPIAQPLLENEIFPPMVAQMVKIGEETGELEKMLSKIADFDRRADHDDRRGRHGRHHHHLDVHADVQDAHARQVAPPRARHASTTE